MKAVLATAVLAVAVSTGSPATAQVYNNQTSWGYWSNQALEAFAQARTPQRRRELAREYSPDGRIHSPNPAWDVYDTSNQYISSDPDMFIRNELRRDPPTRDD